MSKIIIKCSTFGDHRSCDCPHFQLELASPGFHTGCAVSGDRPLTEKEIQEVSAYLEVSINQLTLYIQWHNTNGFPVKFEGQRLSVID